VLEVHWIAWQSAGRKGVIILGMKHTRLPLPGIVHELALSPQGLLFLLVGVSESESSYSHRLLCLKPPSTFLWERKLHPGSEGQGKTIRLGEDGACWFLEPARLIEIDPDGRERRSFLLDLGPDERPGSFLLLPDGYCLSMTGGRAPYANPPRLERWTWAGERRWSTELPLEPITLGRERPWRPSSWGHYLTREPLLLSGDRLLAHFAETSSGIGSCYCLDSQTGALAWQVGPAPCDSLAIVGEGRFLIGEQGYGTFGTSLYGRDGAAGVHWESHGYTVITETGEPRVVEMDNSRAYTHFVLLQENGEVKRGPRLDSYHTIYPAISRQGDSVFWRNGALHLVSLSLEKRVLLADPETECWGRMLLSDAGTLFFSTVGKLQPGIGYPRPELWVVETDLGPLAKSSWPCGSGNLLNNPVYLPV
jgi:hypothetical protein